MSFVDRTSGPDMYDDCDKMIKDSHEQVSAMIASELNNLSSVERATVLDDVHGVGELPQEERNPALLQQKLLELDAALRSIPAKAAFDEAQRLSGGNGGGMVNDPSFRVRFLRAARYDPKAAAVRIVGNLELIREHFGLECLVRPIFLSDMMLDAENQGIESFLFSGDKFQILPFRDRLGRRIVIRSGKKVFDEHIDIRTRIKTLLFVCQELSSDVESQIKGVVMIGFPLERSEKVPAIDMKLMKIFKLFSGKILPVRISAMHICIKDDPWFKLAAAVILRMLPVNFRLRSRIHIGSIDECCYKLMTYGIPGDHIPIKSSGLIKFADHKRFIAFCQEREDAVFRNGTNFRGIYCPSSKDILVGRGPRIKNHIGNEIYRTVLQSKYEQYNSASITKKREIAFEVIRDVHAYGGRFLIPAKNCWVEADAETARAKVSIAFRDVRKTLNAKKNRNYTNSLSKELSAVEKTNSGCL